ncbi:HlyD family type I secretion periplasmic adaptor subunit [Roseobacter sinensis]|uniref:Membrane fusion protein (MFP) family protein n=1 Tax=Roseobacter sinensis TaxID=2931391 RepID=A0ABT3BJ33_9RHOB|nr:HlyD family type I secretion periplasmic adaptor subunit [Roseobacter sp. WL0113]MCV3273585.1 HlyD family type I secretion periplasmic adaptor subunit [Roseobacter sp. WL0113]
MAELIHYPANGDWHADVPRSVYKQVIFGFALMVLTFGGFSLWAFRAPLAAAVISQGSFVATGQNKIVQHLEGGIIRDIVIREGDRVSQGQLLIRLDQTAAAAKERELYLRQMRLEATEARLLAQHERLPLPVFPEALSSKTNDFEIASIIDGQMLAFNMAESALDDDLSLLQRNYDALEVRRVGYAVQLDAHKRQLELLSDELEIKTDLLEDGLIRRSEMTALKRVLIEAEGQIGRLEAEVDEIEQIKFKYEEQINQTDARYRQEALDNLQIVQAELDGIREQVRAAMNVRERADVLAPVSGVVVRLYYHTSGGVIESGRPILEILPEDEPLIVETQIPRADIDSVSTGQNATVRLVALNQRTTPVLNGQVEYVSADAVTNKSTASAEEVYVARITLSPEELRRVANFTPTPGMPAEVMIQTEERTFAQYLAKPVTDSMSRAFREQ